MAPPENPLPLPAWSLDALLQRLAHERPEAIALGARDPGSPAGPDIRYADLAPWVVAVAGQLQTQQGVQAGDRIAWLGLNHPLQIVLLLAK